MRGKLRVGFTRFEKYLLFCGKILFFEVKLLIVRYLFVPLHRFLNLTYE